MSLGLSRSCLMSALTVSCQVFFGLPAGRFLTTVMWVNLFIPSFSSFRFTFPNPLSLAFLGCSLCAFVSAVLYLYLYLSVTLHISNALSSSLFSPAFSHDWIVDPRSLHHMSYMTCHRPSTPHLSVWMVAP